MSRANRELNRKKICWSCFETIKIVKSSWYRYWSKLFSFRTKEKETDVDKCFFVIVKADSSNCLIQCLRFASFSFHWFLFTQFRQTIDVFPSSLFHCELFVFENWTICKRKCLLCCIRLSLSFDNIHVMPFRSHFVLFFLPSFGPRVFLLQPFAFKWEINTHIIMIDSIKDKQKTKFNWSKRKKKKKKRFSHKFHASNDASSFPLTYFN